MTNALKNRLVGTVIVVALTVIFLPDFLDGKKQTNDTLFKTVPEIPDKRPIIEPEPFPTERVKNAAQRPVQIVNDTAQDELLLNSQNQQEASANTNSAFNDKTQSDQSLAEQTIVETPENNTQSAGWVIQLGSFRHQKNVRLLLAKLEKAGYRAFSRPIETQSGRLTKVFVGPDLQKNKLDAALPHLKEITGLNGKVTRFTVQP